MDKQQRERYEMFVQVGNFGTVNRDVFPESSAAVGKFRLLAGIVQPIEEHLVRREQARAEARKVKGATRKAVVDSMRALVSTGRRIVGEEPGTHAFRMPVRRAATVVLTAARLFIEEAERRKEKFVEFGMAPTFVADFKGLVDELATAITVQRDSRQARRKAQAVIDASLAQGTALIRDLDVAVANALRKDAARLAQWEGARHMNRHPAPATPKTLVPAASADAPPVEGVAPVVEAPAEPNDQRMKVAS